MVVDGVGSVQGHGVDGDAYVSVVQHGGGGGV